MTTPDVPLRFDFTIELPGTPEQVWEAIATSNGISSWFLPTDLEEHQGGAIVTHMGETDSPGRVTGWDPPRRLSYEEPDWAGLTGHEGALVTPLATEFLVEAKSGGSCLLRVVTSAFGTGADWEGEWFADMERGWVPFFDRLRLYLTHFPGQRVTPFSVEATLPSAAGAVLSTMRHDLGIDAEGQTVDARGVTGLVERIGSDAALLRLTGPVPGFLGFAAFDNGEGSTMAYVQGQVFSDDAAAFVEREEPAWKAWLEALAVPAS